MSTENPQGPSERPYYPPPPPPPPASPQQQWQAAPASMGVTRPSPRWPLTIIAAVLAFPLGLTALIFSSRTTSKWNAGDVAGAQKSSQYALVWGIVFIVLGFFVFLIALSGS